MSKQEITIAFPETTPDVAGSLAESLAAELRREVKEDGQQIEPTIVRTDPRAQDFGTTIVLVLGAPAVVVLARAIRDWARRTDRGQIEINGARISNVNSADVARIIEALNSGRR